MEKTTYDLEQTVGFDEIEPDEARLTARRLQLYSGHALKVALPIDRIFVNHSRFVSGLQMLDRLFQIAPEVTMPHGSTLIGPTGSGKSALFRHFQGSLPKSSLFTPGFGAIGIRVGSNPSTGALVSAFLRVYKYPFRHGSTSTMYTRADIVFDLIREKGTRLVFIDEAHRLLNQKRRISGDDRDPPATGFLRDLMEECRTGLVLAGTDELDRLGRVDSHLADRLAGRQELKYFSADKEWMGVLRAFKKQSVGFDLSLLEDLKEGKRLHVATGGSLRRLKRLLTEAVLVGVDAGKTALDVECLSIALAAIWGYDNFECNPYAQ